ncbi:hypothetical protein ACLOJK_006208 [Asimina triloba]
MESKPIPAFKTTTHFVSSVESDEFAALQWAISHSAAVGLDAEWKPGSIPNSHSFPPVSILQLAFRARSLPASDAESGSNPLVFLLDLQAIPLPSIWDLLRDMFVSPSILKLGFKFKQDFIYLSSTFCSRGCDPGFEKVEPFLDITSIYYHLKNKHPGRKRPKDTKSLAAICEELLGISLSKDIPELHSSNAPVGLKEILDESDVSSNILRPTVCEASEMVKSTVFKGQQMQKPTSCCSDGNALPLDDTLLKIVRKYSERILLKESDRKPRASKRKARKASEVLNGRKESSEYSSNWQGPPPWDPSLGGDGGPKFLCDVMVEGLAKHLRCVGIDAAIAYSKRPEPRQLIEQALKEKRVLLTRDTKLLKHQYLISDQLYRVKSLLKNDQLIEVIQTFELNISEDQLMSRCTKCNGQFIQKPLTTEEAIAAARGFQIIPKCLYRQNFEFWQCMDCKQLYWEGTQYRNAVQKFIDCEPSGSRPAVVGQADVSLKRNLFLLRCNCKACWHKLAGMYVTNLRHGHGDACDMHVVSVLER